MMRPAAAALACLFGLVACSHGRQGADSDAGRGADASASADSGTGAQADARTGIDAGGGTDASPAVSDANRGDASAGNLDASAGNPDASAGNPDAGTGNPDAGGGILTGGPCISSATGATAYRVRWTGTTSGSTAYVVYEVNGLPDTSRDKTSAYGQIGYTPTFVDPYLGDGGLQLDSSNFIDIELSTVGLSQIRSATLSIYGRSYSTSTSGSFDWQTWDGYNAAPTNLVSNGAPYQWYSADMTSEIGPGEDDVLIRIKAGPSSRSLVVNRIEICMQAL